MYQHQQANATNNQHNHATTGCSNSNATQLQHNDNNNGSHGHDGSPRTSTYDDSMSDEVFEEPAATERRATEHAKIRHQHQQLAAAMAADVAAAQLLHKTPSPSGYPGYEPPREALQMYDNVEEYFQPDRDGAAAVQRLALEATVDEPGDGAPEEVDGWQSYQLEDTFDETIVHKVRTELR